MMTAHERALRATSVCAGWSNGVSVEKIEREIQEAINEALEAAAKILICEANFMAPEHGRKEMLAVAVEILALKQGAKDRSGGA
jgi:histone H3/H4